MLFIISVVLAVMYPILSDLIEMPLDLMWFGMSQIALAHMPDTNLFWGNLFFSGIFGVFSGLLVGLFYKKVFSKFYNERVLIWITGVITFLLCFSIFDLSVKEFFGSKITNRLAYLFFVKPGFYTIIELQEMFFSLLGAWLGFKWALTGVILNFSHSYSRSNEQAISDKPHPKVTSDQDQSKASDISSTQVTENEDFAGKECLKCAEIIKVRAKVCRHCGYEHTEEELAAQQKVLEDKTRLEEVNKKQEQTKKDGLTYRGYRIKFTLDGDYWQVYELGSNNLEVKGSGEYKDLNKAKAYVDRIEADKKRGEVEAEKKKRKMLGWD